MSEPEKSVKQKAPKTKRPKGSADGAARPMSARVERSLKDADRLLAENPGIPAQERAMAQLEIAKVAALLQLADAIRDARGAAGP